MKNLIIDFAPFIIQKGSPTYNYSLKLISYPLGEDFYCFQEDEPETYFKDMPQENHSDDPEKTTNI